MLIRPTTEEDWRALKAIRLAALIDAPTAFGVDYASAAANSDDQWRNRASGRGPARFFIAVEENEAVGLIGGVVDCANETELIAMWVRPDSRGGGVADRLVDAVKALAVANGHARVVLDVSPDNARAASFYRKQGFEFLPEWEALASHPGITVQKMAWRAR
ncbi:GNAT family N-acetyltransferase [Massilia sp. R2A-15]|uniref:GNAT family N-acetyltransferase n=1 Tax=Massilia sp. R2A-15 TaxID=3064278 RepID=UPI0027329FD9|nr:GNAT family N-acetyltransferase [Massilia sp. R2A-15]WLI90381.1 GNAT family N-acetyltransferase [Massilia sp. R2A-15]